MLYGHAFLIMVRFAAEKISGAPLPCCLLEVVPAGCKCFLVKADKESDAAKIEDGEKEAAAGVAADNEKSVKSVAKSLAGATRAAYHTLLDTMHATHTPFSFVDN